MVGNKNIQRESSLPGNYDQKFSNESRVRIVFLNHCVCRRISVGDGLLLRETRLIPILVSRTVNEIPVVARECRGRDHHGLRTVVCCIFRAPNTIEPVYKIFFRFDHHTDVVLPVCLLVVIALFTTVLSL